MADNQDGEDEWHLDKKVTVGMICVFAFWVVASIGYAFNATTRAEQWKTQIEDKIDLLVHQTQPMSDHEHRITVLETQIPAIKEGVDEIKHGNADINLKLDKMNDKLPAKQQ